jgi:hypothetical protein
MSFKALNEYSSVPGENAELQEIPHFTSLLSELQRIRTWKSGKSTLLTITNIPLIFYTLAMELKIFL